MTRHNQGMGKLSRLSVVVLTALAACSSTASHSTDADGTGSTATVASTSSSAPVTSVADTAASTTEAPTTEAPTTVVTTAPPTTAAPVTAPPATAPPATAPPATAPPITAPDPCAGLAASYGPSDGAMGSIYQPVIITNGGGATCTIGAGVTYYFTGGGALVGSVIHDGGPGVTLAPGASATVVIQSHDAGLYDPAACAPAAVNRFRIKLASGQKLGLPSWIDQRCTAGSGQIAVNSSLS